ncbi:MAG TPA: hypothetical protein VMY78_13025 [Solirubrobacteraceae bacterium]|nr:hypothetical protein [Solirubrobacteraceae bacterium]
MAFHRGIDGSQPLRAEPVCAPAGDHLYRDVSRALPTTAGTIACPRCDAPVSLGGRPRSLAEELECPFCRHTGRVHQFLSLGKPTRPAHVRVRARLVAAGERR